MNKAKCINNRINEAWNGSWTIPFLTEGQEYEILMLRVFTSNNHGEILTEDDHGNHVWLESYRFEIEFDRLARDAGSGSLERLR